MKKEYKEYVVRDNDNYEDNAQETIFKNIKNSKEILKVLKELERYNYKFYEIYYGYDFHFTTSNLDFVKFIINEKIIFGIDDCSIHCYRANGHNDRVEIYIYR